MAKKARKNLDVVKLQPQKSPTKRSKKKTTGLDEQSDRGNVPRKRGRKSIPSNKYYEQSDKKIN